MWVGLVTLTLLGLSPCHGRSVAPVEIASPRNTFGPRTFYCIPCMAAVGSPRGAWGELLDDVDEKDVQKPCFGNECLAHLLERSAVLSGSRDASSFLSTLPCLTD